MLHVMDAVDNIIDWVYDATGTKIEDDAQLVKLETILENLVDWETERARDNGFDEGYNEGLSEGKEESYSTGYDDGFSEGQNESGK